MSRIEKEVRKLQRNWLIKAEEYTLAALGVPFWKTKAKALLIVRGHACLSCAKNLDFILEVAEREG